MTYAVDGFPERHNHSEFIPLSDEQIIEIYIDGILRGERPLESNANLRIEPVLNSMQLLSNRDGAISTVNLKHIPTVVEARENSSYWGCIHQKLTQQGYMPFEKKADTPVYRYRYCEAPPNYQLNCTSAKSLWRISWGRGFGLRAGIPLDLIVWCPGSEKQAQPWQSLRGMECDRGKLVIKLLGRSMSLESSDLVVWAKSLDGSPRIRSQDYRQQLRHHRY
ncbi:hypothetical protein [Lyngbya confervoides]|uniref:Uncharacterized protein n=1 Tax=Lyngbya confervoides BDU141951 TaxID=1574623 RepID=A0ABD4T4A7_9CYAN|nr:hypothetical protein [Lyngbya confervoides]MCM1983420.1 hypothetical protein [Lyngbya confervoides BDU141951]